MLTLTSGFVTVTPLGRWSFTVNFLDSVSELRSISSVSTALTPSSVLASPAISIFMGSVRTSPTVSPDGKLPLNTGWIVTIFFVRPRASCTETSMDAGTTLTPCTSRPSALSAASGTCRSKSF